MEYTKLLEAARRFGFIDNDRKAEKAVKTALGILDSRMDDEDARDFAKHLPEQLSYANLHGSAFDRRRLSVDTYINELCRKLGISPDQAQELVVAILHTVRENVDPRDWERWESKLPQDWMFVMEGV